MNSTSLLGLRGMSRDDLTGLLDRAAQCLPMVTGEEPSVPSSGPRRIVANLFLEDSTRTRCSFEVAAKRLGHDTVNLTAKGTSVSKGENLVDTAATIAAMGVDSIVIRCSESGGAALVQAATGKPVINAGDGRHEHPTQGLLDAFTLRQSLGTLDGKTILIVGDIDNSRVARSNVYGLTTLGAQILLVGPPNLVSPRMCELVPEGVEVSHDLDEAMTRADAVMMLRVQRERGASKAISSDYRSAFGMNVDRASRLSPGVPILHPGPSNRGFEIDDEVHDDPDRSLIRDQVTNGVAIRMAALERAMGLD